MLNLFIILILKMSISIHIPFYNPNPEKKEGYRNLTRFDYLKENILNLKKLSLPTDIFIHTHNNFLDDKEFKDFIGSKWWNFKKKVHNFRHNYGITERSSIGFNALNINYFIATLLPEINKQTDPDCFIEHMTNNYYDKFSELKSQNFKDIRGVCTIKINEVIYENKIKEKTIIILYLEQFLKTLFWKLRFLSRLFRK